MKLSEFCRKPVVQARIDDTVVQVAELMREHNVGAVVITDIRNAHDVPVGIVTDRDFAMAVAEGSTDFDDVMMEDVMTPNVILAKEGDDLDDAVQTMRDNGIRRMPVINDENILVGMLSFDDVVLHVARELSTLATLVDVELLREKVLR